VCDGIAKFQCYRCKSTLCTHHATLFNYDDALCHLCRRHAEAGRNTELVRCMDKMCSRMWSRQHIRLLTQSLHGKKSLWVSDKADGAHGERCYGIITPIQRNDDE
jgi:hypothetical protein